MRSVVDTNVLLVANDQHEDASADCVACCVELIVQLSRSGTVVIDDDWRILSEYLHKLDSRCRQPGPGDAFLKWLLQRRANPRHVVEVSVTETAQDWFVEFPGEDLQRDFDPPDRKFIAVAAADEGNPQVVQATDCKWLRWWRRLEEGGIETRFICPKDVRRFYRNKFGEPVPDLPEDV